MSRNKENVKVSKKGSKVLQLYKKKIASLLTISSLCFKVWHQLENYQTAVLVKFIVLEEEIKGTITFID